MVCGFVTGSGAGVARAGTARRRDAACVRMADDAAAVVAAKFPLVLKNKAPYIVFDPIDGEKGVKLELKEVPVFASDDADLGETLFDYDNGKFKPVKAPNMGIAWPSGDGRRIKMTGTKGYYAQPNLKEYGPFPDFFKRSCDG
mmetsp:Transcript_8807/g.23101  ORF Transcript_8807/g.23101 Transcript_8807/m.23101 type:complete len:143 (-) Transcript_8807:361-789(-)